MKVENQFCFSFKSGVSRFLFALISGYCVGVAEFRQLIQ